MTTLPRQATSDAGTGRRKVLFLAQLPPPLHGQSMVSKRVFEIMGSRADLDVEHLWLGGATTLGDVGRRSLAKYLGFAKFLMTLGWIAVARPRSAFAYLTFAPSAHTVLRDGLLIGMAQLVASRALVHLHTEALEQVMTGSDWQSRLVRRLIRGAELITLTQKVADAERARQHFKAVHLLPNCVDDAGEPPFSTSDVLRCGYLANLDPRKGALRFLDCVAAMHGRGLPVKARIAGPSTAALSVEHLTAEVERRGLGGIVDVAGPLYGENKIKFLSEIDLFVYLSRRDYFPLVVIEAMSCGAVPIVLDNEGEKELVGEPFATNVLSPDLDKTAMEAAAAGVAELYAFDRARLMRDRHTARERYLRRYTPDRFRAILLAILDRAPEPDTAFSRSRTLSRTGPPS